MWCHMVADSIAELHEFAERLSLGRPSFQYPKSKYPHYDLTERKRWLAIKMGAVEITSRELVVKSKALRSEAEVDYILYAPSRRRVRGVH
jgi:hypothetical protein